MSKMKLGFFQYAVIQGNPEANFDYISNSLRYCRCDVLVLSELFSCGYCFSRRSEIMSCAESLSNSKTIRFLQNMAVETGGVVTGTFPELDDKEDVLYNTAAVVDQHGLLGIQRKVHLPEYEKQFFSPGCDVVPVEIQNGSKIGLMTCFDCWFPAFGALLKQSGA